MQYDEKVFEKRRAVGPSEVGLAEIIVDHTRQDAGGEELAA